MMSMKISKTTNLPKKNSRPDIIVDIEANKKLYPIVTELFFKRQKTQYFNSFSIVFNF